MKQNSVLLFMSFLLLVLQGCGGDGNTVDIGAPTYATPTQSPLEVEEQETEEDITIYDIDKSDPCYKFIRHEIVKPVATCTKLENGRIKDAYKITVRAARVCLLRKSFPNGVNLYTLIGGIQEKKKNEQVRNYKLDVFGQAKFEDNLLKFEMKSDNQTFVKYSLTQNSVTVRQLSKTWKKRRRYFRISCRPIADIVD